MLQKDCAFQPVASLTPSLVCWKECKLTCCALSHEELVWQETGKLLANSEGETDLSPTTWEELNLVNNHGVSF